MFRRAHDTRLDELTRLRLAALKAELSDPDSAPPPPRAPAPPAATSAGGEQAAVPSREPAVSGAKHAGPRRGAGARTLGWVADRLPAVPRLDAQRGAAQVGLVALVLAVGVMLTAWWLMRSSDEATPAPPRALPAVSEPGDAAPGQSPSRAARAGRARAGTAAADAGHASTAARTTIVVDVVGKVRRPGIAVLPAGARVVDAVRAAGGLRRSVDRIGLNMARALVDGEQLLIGVAPPAGTAGSAGASLTPGAGAAPTPLVNINTADQATLETLPGVGPVTAAAILEWRAEHQVFTAVEELLEVSGIGEATLEEIAPHVTL